ncbi:MAG: DNA mismatch repair protein [Ekhidna sp.]|nr:DNA mismatch repair protein [Ekhidna sp.]
MKFITDNQTLSDLNVLGKYNPTSIFSIFNKTRTKGGGRLLETMFSYPLTNVEAINDRSEVFSFFETLDVTLPFSYSEFELAENYLKNGGYSNKLLSYLNGYKAKVMRLIATTEEYDVLKEGLEATIKVLANCKDLFEHVKSKAVGTKYENTAEETFKILNDQQLLKAYVYKGKHLNFNRFLKLDTVFRTYLSKKTETLIKNIYAFDVYLAVSKVSKFKGYTYAKALDKAEKVIDMKGAYHPSIPNAITNDILIDSAKNVMFLTGANMAGKSTLMKTAAINFYLAHMGFPVAAKQMRFSLHDGIYTSINVPDNIDKGYSHFYAEVLRVKHVAEEVASDKKMLIIFDELFKGTNVKDAYDGTISVIDAFSKRNGAFIISTHIIEAGETLQKQNDQLFFKYLPTVVKKNVPSYTYKLEDGISDDRQGMMIINREQILETIMGVY